MNESYSNRDLELISTYLDSQLSPAINVSVKARLQSDPELSRIFDELAYTRRLLKALPQKRAPRNFTLSAEKVKAPRRALWLQPAMSFVSVAAAVMLVVVFTTTFLMGGTNSAVSSEMAPQPAMLAAEDSSTGIAPPVIINWNPVLGMGGGGDGTAIKDYAGGVGGGGAGGPGWDITDPAVGGGAPDPTPAPEEAPLTAMAEPAPEEPVAKSAAESDPSNLILGLPEEDIQGQIIVSQQQLREKETSAPFPRNLIMGISGIVAILAGAAALLLRRL